MRALFEKMQVPCDIAEDGEKTLQQLAARRYDLLLLDMHMPIMDGLETLKRIREDERYSDLKIVALTANAMKGDREKYLAAGCDDYLAKPLEVSKLRRVIEKFLVPPVKHE